MRLLPFLLLLYIVNYDWPQQANWLAPQQRQWITESLDRQAPAQAGSLSILQTLRSRTVLLLSSAAAFAYFFGYAFLFWVPTLLKRQSGLSDLRVGFLGALPFLAEFLAMQVLGWHSDKAGERRWHAAFPIFIGAVGLLGLLISHLSFGAYLLLFTAAGVGSAYLPILWAIPTEILGKTSAANAVGIINACGSLAGFLGPYSFGYLYERTGSFSAGLLLMAVTAVIGALLILRVPASSRPGTLAS